MASCNISIKNTTNDRIYLKGRVTGLSSSKTYCMLYRAAGSWTNLSSKNFGYTYFGNASSFNLGDAGCYISKSGLSGIVNVDVACYEVRGNCETRVGKACQKTVNVEEDTDTPPSSCVVTFYVSDDQPTAMRGVKIKLAGTTITTGSDGKARLGVMIGKRYTANAIAPSGYNPVFPSKTFTPTKSMTIPLKFERISSGNGDGNGNGDTRHTVTFFVKDQDGFPVHRAGIKTDGVYQCYTGADGKCTMRPEDTGSGHKAILTVLPDGYVKTSDTVKLFFHEPNNFITYTCKRKTATPPPPSNGDDNGYVPPSGANRQLVIGLTPLPWANRSGLMSVMVKITDIVAKNLAAISGRYTVIGTAKLVDNNIIINIRRD